ncbi:MAG: phage tail protein [Methylobacter sp.]
MSGGSIGTIVGGIVGGIIGFFAGGNVYAGAMLGMAVGGLVGGALDPPPKGPDVTGPRLGDLTVQTSSYGAFIPRVYGTIAIYGNIFWLENNALKEVVTKKKQGGKGMGGGSSPAQTTYAYFATFALGLCEGPIGAVKRIWIGGKLFYDAGSSDIYSIIASNETAKSFAIYTGSESQNADPRMQATLGVANTPAYRGIAYIVFYDLPLADYGNSLAATQIKVEIVKNASYSGWQRTVNNTDIGFNFTRPYITRVTDGIISVSAPTWTTEYLYDFSGVFLGKRDISVPILWYGSSYPYFPCGKLAGQHVWVNPTIFPSAGSTLSYDAPVVGTGIRLDTYLPQDRAIYGVAIANDGNSVWVICGDVGEINPTDENAPVWYILDADGRIIKTGTIAPSLANLTDIYTFGFSRYGSYGYASCSFDSITNTIATAYGAGLHTVDIYFIDNANVLNHQYVGTQTIGQFNYPSVYMIKDLIFLVAEDDINIFTINLMTQVDQTLGTIINAESSNSNLIAASDIDVTELTQTVRGYRISSIGAIRAAIEPLRGAYPFDVVQHGYKIKFVKRGSASIANITAAELDAREAGAANGVSVTNSREMDSQLPQKVTVKYFDFAREYDNGEQYAERINTEAINIRGIEIPVVLTADEAAQIAATLLYLYWMERYDISFKLPPEYNYLEPSDIITITTDNAVYVLRLTSIAYTAKGWLECQAKYNKSAIYTQESKGSEGGPSGPGLTISGPSNYVLLDIPLIQDVYDMAGFPVAMTGYLPGWPGGVIYRSDDNGQTWADVQAFGKAGSTIGYALTSLGTHSGTVLDKAGTLAVRMYNAAVLSSVTEAQMFSGQNWFAYGDDQRWEIIAAQNCVLQGDGSYILSDFMRGQFGTEWASGLHAVNDKLVYLSSDELAFVLVNSSSIGVSKLYRAITAGKALDSDSDMAFSYRGTNLECLSPCALTGNRHPSTNDWTLTWTRRSRFGGWRDLVDSALGETTEAYEIDIFSSGTYATLKRTLTASTQTVAYSSAQQNTDFGSNQGTLYIKIYQLSSVVGRGYPLIAQIIR